MTKSESLNIALTDEMKKFILSKSGKGTLYATPSEYVRDLIRHERDRLELSKFREHVIEGYEDVIDGNVHEFSGNLISDMNKYKNFKAK